MAPRRAQIPAYVLAAVAPSRTTSHITQGCFRRTCATKSDRHRLVSSFIGTSNSRFIVRSTFKALTEFRIEAGIISLDNSEEAVPSPAISLDDATKSKFNNWRNRVFAGIMLGYVASYFTRTCFTYASPILRASSGITLQQLGVITSVFPMAHGISKFVSGVIADRVDARYFLAIGLIATGFLDMLMTLQPSVQWMSFIWGLNGWVSAFVVPACARLLTTWFSSTERGFWWGLWNSSANIGGFATAIIAAYFASKFGWQMGMYVPGVIGIVAGLGVIALVRTDPSEVGLPTVEEYRGEAPAAPKPKEAGEALAEGEMSKNEIFKKYVLMNPKVWGMAICYLFLYFVRTGVTNWSHFYLMDVKGVTDATDAATRVSGRELGGLLGNLASGAISDKYFKGRRVPVICAFLVGIIASLCAFWALPGGNRWLDYITIFILGFFVYGPHMLIGLAGTELSHKSAASSAIGFLGLISYIGAGIAGAPLTMLVKNYGWGSFFQSMLVCCVLSMAICIPMWNAKAESAPTKTS
mmetsp:Transcript_32358/g.52296  ORF Transcript_32358/g.52296 Transcript_32358/m.52296 type:complete len:525 (+) Transcript_32358:56-1630(+)|eukprot:CAMPEP_0184336016 /NCGR_PEP_ID=MMETSP1089-20130417/4473_1 /TAXON_ID=38269 ORGANISM="Gloeochaete wittrockiana, Strain SAG46.84" /NCGR_SAMPLE_ID=MMETSP1089 /ASSEMBLY_ACC=CAM_ASM_000445 /LENGTH=524 /DNA_ID=CAMNT_0026660941 /DNA_START=65 /DNA_END=1639 /DNA_ORIENTATION=+